ncbi:MAG: patatin [Gammaproteobacteria bacterium]|nr:patatin [Gammaproteobacteria bacterium]
MSKIALYLAGGGARGAYQAGVLKAIYSILRTHQIPFEIITGVSVGSVNASIIAQHADNFQFAVEQLEELWCSIHCNKIFNVDNFNITKSFLRNFGIMFLERRQSGYLLDTSPLTEFLKKQIHFRKIAHNIDTQKLKMFEIICMCYDTQQNYSFCQQNDPDFSHWQHYKHISSTTNIKLEHILASGALPLFFSPVTIDDRFYGDGSMGLISPLRGAVHTKADKVLIISNRHPMNAQNKSPLKEIGFGQILGTMLSSLFQDNLDRDIEIVNHLNDISDMISMWNKRYSPWQDVKTMHLRPNTDLAKIAIQAKHELPMALKTVLSIFGGGAQSGELTSFLLFESSFTTEIFNLGYDDTLQMSENILDFFEN